MRAVVQRVSSASVTVDGEIVGKIGKGLLVLLGIKKDDTDTQQEKIIKKILNLRVFFDGQKEFDKSVVAVGGEILLVSQFTLYGDCTKGNRPSFFGAMSPQEASIVYKEFAKSLRQQYPKVQEGVFGAYMQVALVNDGPATILLES